ncbi:SAM-dependent methyltransferase [Pelagivirga sediminicola]|uniref:SAM-dependent methyltransferase n=1 Tax=Pelagivirga sediminicola TaxID=2170575 RepID=A0A2T7GAK7_9RHOB|nr:RsmB/NOP family class I SAM-dependent RNA methyltransferase [Pelagivirga sediminicola]PVA11451.1 SAM-dependent methyltransferase [Pelagivirga sediminicola]
MTPGARVLAAIEVLDLIAAGTVAEKALIGWARRSRFAGSGDRAAVRDHVFQALRCWRSYAVLGGAETGRARMIGALRAAGDDPAALFTGEGYAPAPLSADERAAGAQPTGADACDMPDWLLAEFHASLGPSAEQTVMALRERAPVMLRVNRRKADVTGAIDALAHERIISASHPVAETALTVSEGARRVAQSRAYHDGLVELQDGSSQAAMDGIDLSGAKTILDYCAGGGGKALALAARSDARIFAHDIDPGRMQDLPERAARAGVRIEPLNTLPSPDKHLFDIVLCDAPCSGSGTWRRTPEAKWSLTPARLSELTEIQAQILTEAAPLVAPGGQLIYATCSVLAAENEAQIDAFLAATPGWVRRKTHRFDVTDGGDGFFVAHLGRD